MANFGINIGQEFKNGLNFFGELGGGTDLLTVTPQLKKFIKQDIRFLKSLGIKRFRYGSPDFTWTARLEYIKEILETIVEEGDLHIEYGVGTHAQQPYRWPDFLDMVDNEVLWFQDLIDTYASRGVTGGWYVGNELEQIAEVQDTLVSFTRTSNVITAVWPYQVRLFAGDQINFTSTFADGFYTVASAPDAYSATFNVSGADNTQTGGKAQLGNTWQRRMRRLATHFKNDLGITLPLSYSVLQGWAQTNTAAFTRQFKPGAGFPSIGGYSPLDFIDVNAYGTSSLDPEENFKYFKIWVDNLISDIGAGHCRVTEWNVFHNDNDNRQTMNNNLKARWEQMIRRRKYLDKLNIPHYFFTWRMNEYLGVRFPVYGWKGGGVRPEFYKILGIKSPYVEIVPK